MTREKFLELVNSCLKAHNEAIAQASAIEILKTAGLENEESVVKPMRDAIVRAKADEIYVKESIGRALSGSVADLDTLMFLKFATDFSVNFKTKDEQKVEDDSPLAVAGV